MPTWQPITIRQLAAMFVSCSLMLPASLMAEPQQKEDGNDPVADSSWKYRVRLNKFERQFSTRDDQDYGEWAGSAMVRTGKNGFWFNTKGSTQHRATDSAEIRLSYIRRIKRYIGLMAGWRRDIKPTPDRDWLSLGVLGVMPYKIGTDLSLFFGESGRMAARLEVAYKYRFTQKLSLTPDLEANFYSEDGLEREIGSGLSDLDIGLRLRYQVIKGVSPYTGIVWKGNFGKTADIIESGGGDSSDFRWMLGATLWF